MLAFRPTRHTRMERVQDTSTHHWSLTLGGTADADNTRSFHTPRNPPLLNVNGTRTRKAKVPRIAFMPPIELSIINAGRTPVVNPRITSNGRRAWSTIEDIVAIATEGAQSDEERLLFIWDFLRRHHTHWVPLNRDSKSTNELHNPVRYLNSCAQAAALVRARITLLSSPAVNCLDSFDRPPVRCSVAFWERQMGMATVMTRGGTCAHSPGTLTLQRVRKGAIRGCARSTGTSNAKCTYGAMGTCSWTSTRTSSTSTHTTRGS